MIVWGWGDGWRGTFAEYTYCFFYKSNEERIRNINIKAIVLSYLKSILLF